jgi:hypothetical protein
MINISHYAFLLVFSFGLSAHEGKKPVSLVFPWHVTVGNHIPEISIQDEVEKIDGGIKICTTVHNISQENFYFDKILVPTNSRNQFINFTYALEFNDPNISPIAYKDTKRSLEMPESTLSPVKYVDDYYANEYIIDLPSDKKIEFCRPIAFLQKHKSIYVITHFSPRVFDKVNDQYIPRKIKDLRSLSNINIIYF